MGMLCTSAAASAASSAPDFACDVCMKAAKYLDDNVFESAEVDKKVAEKLKKMCTDIPDITPKDSKKCELMVEVDTPAIMEAIGEEISEKLCSDAGVCT